MMSMLAAWDEQDVTDLSRLLRRLADDALEFVREDDHFRPG
jgi:hypothetical protein